MDANAYREQLARLHLAQTAAAVILGVDERTSRRWAKNELGAPETAQRLLWACERFPAVLEALRDWPPSIGPDVMPQQP